MPPELQEGLLIRTKDGRMVASKAPSRIRQMIRPVKFVAAPVQAVTIDQEIILNMTQYLTTCVSPS